MVRPSRTASDSRRYSSWTALRKRFVEVGGLVPQRLVAGSAGTPTQAEPGDDQPQPIGPWCPHGGYRLVEHGPGPRRLPGPLLQPGDVQRVGRDRLQCLDLRAGEQRKTVRERRFPTARRALTKRTRQPLPGTTHCFGAVQRRS